jgi:hypothetical protein
MNTAWGRVKIKKGQDRNPARFKIQYPMKNHNNICNTYTSFMFIWWFNGKIILRGKDQ